MYNEAFCTIFAGPWHSNEDRLVEGNFGWTWTDVNGYNKLERKYCTKVANAKGKVDWNIYDISTKL